MGAFKCSACGHTSEEGGEHCNMPMAADEGGMPEGGGGGGM